MTEADDDLRQRLAALGATSWMRCASVVVAFVHERAYLDRGDRFISAPCTHQDLAVIALAAQIGEDDDVAGFLELYHHATGARVTVTHEDLHFLTLDQPGPEIIRSGTIGAAGLARWSPPLLAGDVLTFYANVPSAEGADFVCVRYELITGAISKEVVDRGWFEIAARLG